MKTDVQNRFVWLDGAVVNVNEAKMNVLTPSFQFGLNVFEGIRCYWDEESRRLFAFRLFDHFRRLKQSQRLLQMEDRYTVDELKQALFEAVLANQYQEDIAVRQTLFVEGFGSWSSAGPVNMFVAPIPKAKTNPEYNKKGLHCCISSWERIHDNALSPRIKCGANYINSRMAQLEALRNGYDTTIFLGREGKVAEGPGSCLFLVKNGVLITPQLTDSVLESITRDTLITLAKEELGLTVQERSVDRTELYLCEEAFLCGSAMEITPIFSVDRYPISDGAGPITEKLHRLYLDVVTGKCPKYHHWLTEVK